VSKDPALQALHLSLVPKGDGGPPHADDSYRFTLYVAGDTPKSLAAIANLRKLCELHLAGRHSIDVVDLMKNPELAATDQILAVPTLVRRLPAPIKRVIGSLADVEKVLVGLELRSDAP
jgi:circadian clock protein KaiB